MGREWGRARPLPIRSRPPIPPAFPIGSTVDRARRAPVLPGAGGRGGRPVSVLRVAAGVRAGAYTRGIGNQAGVYSRAQGGLIRVGFRRIPPRFFGLVNRFFLPPNIISWVDKCD